MSLVQRTSSIHGDGVFTSEDMPPDTYAGELFELTSEGELRFEHNEHLTFPAHFTIERMCLKLNHQDNANCMVMRMGRKWLLYTDVYVSKNHELTIDYKRLPYFMDRDIRGFV